MKRFLLTSPDLLVGARNDNAFSKARLIKTGQIAVLEDDDIRVIHFRNAPYWVEVDENDKPLPKPEVVAAVQPRPVPEEAKADGKVYFEYPATISTKVNKAKGLKADPESEVCA